MTSVSSSDGSPASTFGYVPLRLLSFESRRADEMRVMIEKQGATAMVAPSMRELPLDANPVAFAFAERLLAGQIDVVIFMTGVGARALLEAVEQRIPRDEFLAALSGCRTVVRGPKPTTVLREWKVRIDDRVPEPNTWHEVLATLDANFNVAGKVVAVQEYGEPSDELYRELEQRGAEVVRVPVYRWALPEDTAPLVAAIRATIAGECDVLMFTSANQLQNVLTVADAQKLKADWLDAARRSLIASIGPTCSERLRENDLPPDFEPSHPKMGHLVIETIREAPRLLAEKRGNPSVIGSSGLMMRFSPKPTALRSVTDAKASAWVRHGGVLQSGETKGTDSVLTPELRNSRFLRAARCEPTDTTPIWIMRQAGRYLPEYMAVRSRVTFLELCKTPELAAEVTLTAQRVLGVDAAILFADLLPILEPMGFDLEYQKGEGPVIHNPLRTGGGIDRVREVEDVSVLNYVFEAVRLIRRDLPADIPLLGFAGAPFTLASYAIEGGGSKNYVATKSLMMSDRGAWDALMRRLVRSLSRYLAAQIEAGCQAVQVFDSWAGCLSPADYRDQVLPYTKLLIESLPADIPVINFLTGNPALLPLQRQAGGLVMGLDWRVDLREAWATVGHDVAVQGNLDPVSLFADLPVLRSRAKAVLDAAEGRPGHIFNLGHGVMPEMQPENVKGLVEMVHELGAR